MRGLLLGVTAVVACAGCALVTGVGDLEADLDGDAGLEASSPPPATSSTATTTPTTGPTSKPLTDAGTDAGVDAGTDAGVDAGTDAGVDAGTDAGVDAGTDAGVDAGTDAGVDAGTDAGVDAGTDAGTDAGGVTSKLVFVTTAKFTGDLGGVSGADAKCDAEAGAASGSYVAWVALEGLPPQSAISRLTPGVPFVLKNGNLAFSSASTIEAAGRPKNSINITFAGAVIPQPEEAWTGLGSDGTPYLGETCNGWTSGDAIDDGVTGRPGSLSVDDWSDYDDDDCDTLLHIYCFEK